MQFCFTPCFPREVKIENAINSLHLARVLFDKRKQKNKLLWHFNNKLSVNLESFLFLIYPSLSSSGGFTPLTFAKDFEVSRVFDTDFLFYFLLSDAKVVIPLASWQLVLTPNSLRGFAQREVATAKKIVKPKTICGIRKQRLAPDFLSACGVVRQIFQILEDWNSNAWWSSFKREALLSIWDEQRWQQAGVCRGRLEKCRRHVLSTGEFLIGVEQVFLSTQDNLWSEWQLKNSTTGM